MISVLPRCPLHRHGSPLFGTILVALPASASGPPADLQEAVISPRALVPTQRRRGAPPLHVFSHSIKRVVFSSVTPGKLSNVATGCHCDRMELTASAQSEKWTVSSCLHILSSSALPVDCLYASRFVSQWGCGSCLSPSLPCHLASVHALCHQKSDLMPCMYYSAAICWHAA